MILEQQMSFGRFAEVMPDLVFADGDKVAEGL
jgi:hypothetical protein